MSDKDPYDGLAMENIHRDVASINHADYLALKDKYRREPKGGTVLERQQSEGAKIDRRKLRVTGRTEVFTARVTAETKEALHAYANANNLLLGELLERTVEFFITKKR